MRTLQLDDFYKYKFLSGLEYNKSGSLAAVIRAEPDVENNGYKKNLYLIDGDTVKPFITDGKVGGFIWEDDEHILFAANRSDAEKKRRESGDMFTAYYRISVKGGEALPAFTLPFTALSIDKISDELFAATGAVDVNYPDFYTYDADKRKETAAKYKAEADYEVIDENPWWFNGTGMINKKRCGLFVCNVKTGEVKMITPANFRVGDYCEKDGVIYYAGEEYTEKMADVHFIYSYDTKTGRTKQLTEKPMSVSYMDWVDNMLVISGSYKETYGVSQSDCLYKLSFDGGEPEMFLYTEQGPGNSVGSDCRLGGNGRFATEGDKVYFVSTVVNAAHLICSDLSGKAETIIGVEGTVDGFDIKKGKIILVGMYDMKLQEVYTFDGKLHQVSHFNEDILKNTYVAKPNKMTIKSQGYDIDGWVLLPKDYDRTKKYPAILDIHGGPKTAYGEVFYHEMQAWANMGYFVFFCNPYGSDGKGNEFGDLRGKYGTTDYLNIMDFTDRVLAAYPQIDKEKVAVTGGSYGGFMTNWIIGHTDRFVAAATQRSISNWISFYGISDIGIMFGTDQCAATVFTPEGVEKMWNASPLKYVANMKTPTLFIHSDQDYRCPIAEGYQLYTALKDKGVDSRMCVFHGENHELSRGGKPLHRLRRLTEITDWIVKYTK